MGFKRNARIQAQHVKCLSLDGLGVLANIVADITVTSVKALAVLGHSLIIGNFSEGGNARPSRVRWSDTGDSTEW